MYCMLGGYLLSCSSVEEDDNYKVFRYNQINHITSLDPAFAKSQNNIWAVHHLYNGLVKLDDSLNIIPDIAKSWEIDDSGTTYTFYLKGEVFFHDNACFAGEKGRKVTAHDFVYSFNRLIDSEVNSPGSWLFSDKVSADPFKAVNDSVFSISIDYPFLPLLGILTMQYCSVVPQEAVAHYGNDFFKNPVGTGPFKFKKWAMNQALFLNRNRNYHDSIYTNLDGIKTSFIPDKKISYLELLNGKLDYVSGLESTFINELLNVDGTLNPEKEEVIKFTKSPYLNFEYMGINYSEVPDNSPLRHKGFRQALNYGVNRESMLRTLRNNVGKPANAGVIPRGLPSHNPSIVKGYSYNPEKARALINKLDFKEPPQIEVYTNKDYLDLTTFIAKQWEEIGVEVSIEVLESGILRDGMVKGDLPMFRASWIADYPDGESFLCLFYSKYPAPPNYTRFSHVRYDSLYEEAIKATDLDKRVALYHEMENILIDEAPVIFLFYDETAQFYANDVTGISTNAINLLKVDSIRMQ